MTGTFINVVTILTGGLLGLLFGARLPDKMRRTVIAGLGLFTLAYGLQMFTNTGNPLIVVGSLLIGAVLGEWMHIEEGLRNLGAFLERKFAPPPAPDPAYPAPPNPEGSRFIRGFLTASLVYCIGPMAILGSIQDGLYGDYNLLAIKSLLDGFASLAFASSLGIGVVFSILPVFVYQGGLSLLAAQAETLISDSMANEMTAVGGVILLGVAISSLLEIKPIRVGSFLPALLIAPLIAWLVERF